MKPFIVGQLTSFERAEIVTPQRMWLETTAKELTRQFREFSKVFDGGERDSKLFKIYRDQMLTIHQALRAVDDTLKKF